MSGESNGITVHQCLPCLVLEFNVQAIPPTPWQLTLATACFSSTACSPDGADVAAPVSLMEWFLNFYNAARKGEDSSDSDSDIDPEALGPSSNGSAKGGPAAAGAACPSRHALHGGVARSRARAAPRRHVRPMECIVNAGELLFVPRGW